MGQVEAGLSLSKDLAAWLDDNPPWMWNPDITRSIGGRELTEDVTKESPNHAAFLNINTPRHWPATDD